MTREQARDYVSRWERVAEFKRQEVRRMTPAEKLDTLNRLMQWAEFFGYRETPISDKREIWERWNHLREAHRG